jgi:hypothetical protein
MSGLKFIDKFIAEWALRRWSLVGGSRPLGIHPGRVYLVPGPFFSGSFCIIAAIR